MPISQDMFLTGKSLFIYRGKNPTCYTKNRAKEVREQHMALSLSTKKLSQRKSVLIDGTPYTVRRFGNIEQLEMNQLMRELQGYADTEKALPKGETLTAEDLKEVERISLELASMYIRLFDDGEDGTKSKELVASLNNEELAELLSQIFAEPKKAANGSRTKASENK